MPLRKLLSRWISASCAVSDQSAARAWTHARHHALNGIWVISWARFSSSVGFPAEEWLRIILPSCTLLIFRLHLNLSTGLDRVSGEESYKIRTLMSSASGLFVNFECLARIDCVSAAMPLLHWFPERIGPGFVHCLSLSRPMHNTSACSTSSVLLPELSLLPGRSDSARLRICPSMREKQN